MGHLSEQLCFVVSVAGHFDDNRSFLQTNLTGSEDTAKCALAELLEQQEAPNFIAGFRPFRKVFRIAQHSPFGESIMNLYLPPKGP